MTSPFDTLWTPHDPVLGWWAQEFVPATILTPPAMAAAGHLATPTLTHTLTAPAGHATAVMPAPTVFIGGAPIIITAPKMTATALIPNPTLSAALTVPKMTAAATPVAPALTSTAIPPVIHATASMPTPGVDAPIQITAPTMTAAAVIPAPTVAIPAAPAFDAVGTGGNTTGLGGTTASGTHTAAAGATILAFIKTSGATTVVSSATFGGIAMTLVGSVMPNNSASEGVLSCYKLAGAPGGTQTVAITASTSNTMGFGSISYTGVTTVGAPSTTFGSSTTPTQALTCTTNQIIADAIATHGGITATSGGTNRYLGLVGATVRSLAISDATTPATFTATITSAAWAELGVVLS